jgi:hypothetical protein
MIVLLGHEDSRIKKLLTTLLRREDSRRLVKSFGLFHFKPLFQTE